MIRLSGRLLRRPATGSAGHSGVGVRCVACELSGVRCVGCELSVYWLCLYYLLIFCIFLVIRLSGRL